MTTQAITLSTAFEFTSVPFHFERTTDWELIKSIVTHPRIWPWISDDLSCKPEEWQPLKNEVFYLKVSDQEGLLGIWCLRSCTSTCWEVHTCLLPRAYGNSIAASKAAIRWVFVNTPCTRLITAVPSDNRLALRLARRAGMLEFGCNPKSFVKRGEFLSQYMLGISKDEVTCL